MRRSISKGVRNFVPKNFNHLEDGSWRSKKGAETNLISFEAIRHSLDKEERGVKKSLFISSLKLSLFRGFRVLRPHEGLHKFVFYFRK